MEEHEPKPVEASRSDRPPLPLEYGRAVTMPMAAQVAIGFAAWVATAASVFVILQGVSGGSPFEEAIILLVIALALVGIVVLCVVMRRKYQWRGFIPGVLLGVALNCLLPLGILAILCAQM
jgi:hypothetical protein